MARALARLALYAAVALGPLAGAAEAQTADRALELEDRSVYPAVTWSGMDGICHPGWLTDGGGRELPVEPRRDVGTLDSTGFALPEDRRGAGRAGSPARTTGRTKST